MFVLKKCHDLQTMVLAISFKNKIASFFPLFIIAKSRFAFEIAIKLILDYYCHSLHDYTQELVNKLVYVILHAKRTQHFLIRRSAYNRTEETNLTAVKSLKQEVHISK